MVERSGGFVSEELASKEIPVYRIKGFAKADGYVVTEQDVLKRKLRGKGLYGDRFAYRAFDPNRIDIVVRTGSDRVDNTLFCCFLHERDGGKSIQIDDGSDLDIVYYMDENRGKSKSGVFAVYDKNQLVYRVIEVDADDDKGDLEFRDSSKKLDALLAVFVVEDFDPSFAK